MDDIESSCVKNLTCPIGTQLDKFGCKCLNLKQNLNPLTSITPQENSQQPHEKDTISVKNENDVKKSVTPPVTSVSPIITSNIRNDANGDKNSKAPIKT